MPIWKKRSGYACANRCRSVYLARSAVRPTTSGRVAAYSTSALPNGAALTRCPSEAIDAIIAEVVRRGFFSATGLFIGIPPCYALRYSPWERPGGSCGDAFGLHVRLRLV